MSGCFRPEASSASRACWPLPARDTSKLAASKRSRIMWRMTPESATTRALKRLVEGGGASPARGVSSSKMIFSRSSSKIKRPSWRTKPVMELLGRLVMDRWGGSTSRQWKRWMLVTPEARKPVVRLLNRVTRTISWGRRTRGSPSQTARSSTGSTNSRKGIVPMKHGCGAPGMGTSPGDSMTSSTLATLTP